MSARPKTSYYRDRKLLNMAKGQPCLFKTEVCTGGGEDTVAAHSNLGSDAKGGAIKAHDCMSAWACYACHTAYDSGPADAVVKQRWFAWAHERQMLAWQEIACNPSARPIHQSTARLALQACTAISTGKPI